MPAPDYFAFFGLEPKLNLDSADLQRRFYRLSRELHPDRFARATPAERERAQEATAVLNDAYRVLRDPVARAEYLLGGVADSQQTPPELLEEVFELNEALEMLDRPQIEAARERFRARIQAQDAAFPTLFEQRDVAHASACSRGLQPLETAPIDNQLRRELAHRRYYQKLLARIEGVMNHV